MTDDTDLGQFTESLQDDLRAEAGVPGAERNIRDVFLERMVGELTDVAELEGGEACFHQARGEEISGYNISVDGQTLDLFGVVLRQVAPPAPVGKAEIETCLRRLRGFLEKVSRNRTAGLEVASPVFDMAHSISQVLPELTRVRFWLFTDGGVATRKDVATPEFGDVPTSVQVWDVVRLHRLVTSGRQQEPIHVDFLSRFGAPVPCLPTDLDEQGCHTMLAIVPGTVLKEIYATYSARLLELNVRSFLQARGKVNQGIRDTILNEPRRFLAYNNGISATASAVDIVRTPEGGSAIASLQDLQIVNGGQTTASLYHAAVRHRATLDGIHVQMKLTVVPPDQLAELVPLISRYANSQNKVQEADFSTSHSFHVDIERLSRSVWAPATNGSQRQTRWFYERARGQYQDELARTGTPARQKAFKEIHPAAQKFVKTDLAKFELAWDEAPHAVSLGGQKCFAEFALRLAQRPEQDQKPSRRYYEHLVAKAILFRQTDRIVARTFRESGLEGYKAQVVAYAVALISNRTSRRLDLDVIWRTQQIPEQLRSEIPALARLLRSFFDRTPGNVGEWAKKPACWEKARALPWKLSGATVAQLTTKDPIQIVASSISTEDLLLVPWSELAAWAGEHNKLTAVDRRIASGTAVLLSAGKTPTDKQIDSLRRIYDAALNNGFALTGNTDA
ncbi:AIPR family protein [Frankia sp. Mgl5]|uniref:AIPR family protein n=1 Tax=unclassified Frankia TaxID=2632575 RepID=UPI002010324E|nr:MULTISPECIES: AIPR family protein [unclassified Frankia]MCK9893123.1 AIPR family protein [Frankia sp. AgB32]MCK9928864.1 AIPR family protein [Frankia sp. Mgl5]